MSGIEEFAKEMEEKGLGKPKVSLHFELSASGITDLVKAEAAVEEIYTVQEEVEVDDDEEAADNSTERKTEETPEEAEKEEAAEESAEADETKDNETKAEETEEPKKEKKTKLVDKVCSTSSQTANIFLFFFLCLIF